MARRLPKSKQRFSEINAIPLIDVLLVLLVIFMVTAPLYLQELQLELPTVDANQKAIEPKSNDITIFITNLGHIHIDDMNSKSLTVAQVLNHIKSASEQTPPEIYIQADKKTAYGTVVGLLSSIESQGITQFHLVNTASDEASA